MAGRVKFNYERGLDGILRPYLWLNLNVEGGLTVKMRGVLDSGADTTVLAMALMHALGMKPGDLESLAMRSPSGEVSAARSRRVVLASLPGEKEIAAPLRPIFVPGDTQTRWGRDFMAAYSVAFDEQARQFSLFGSPLGPKNAVDEP